MSCLSCENYIPLHPPIQRTDAKGQTYTVPGLCKIGADHIICGLPVYLPTAKCDKIIEAPPKDGSGIMTEVGCDITGIVQVL
jgi:hypothetical protein